MTNLELMFKTFLITLTASFTLSIIGAVSLLVLKQMEKPSYSSTSTLTEEEIDKLLLEAEAIQKEK